MKTYIGISRDHSGSMYSLAKAALKDYNDTLQLLKSASQSSKQDTILSVVTCGSGRNPTVGVEVHNQPIDLVQPISTYTAQAVGTPLFDSVGALISTFEATPDINNPDASFLVLAITDGEENYSKSWYSSTLTKKIKELQATDRWTFVFRVPPGYGRQLMKLGIPEGNIFEWDQSERGVQESTVATKEAFENYYSGLQTGVKSTTRFFTNLQNISVEEIKNSLVEVTNQVQIWHVDTAAEGNNIREYCRHKLGHEMKKGAAFYQLIKPEREVQDYKKIIIRDKTTSLLYAGKEVRKMLGLPEYGTIKITPGDHGNYEIFIQSTSVNRKLPVGTTLVYWESV